jgi:hypothetical protein
MATFRAWKVQDAIEWFHGIGRLVRYCTPVEPRAGPLAKTLERDVEHRDHE